MLRTLRLKISNLAPIANIDKTLNLGTIDVGFFARNGCGKTYISRIFNLLANQESDDYNMFVRKGEDQCNFEFSVNDVENIKLDIVRDNTPSIPDTFFIYHVFNEDYTEKHYKENYNKDGNIEGVILGKEKKAVEDKIESIRKTKAEQQKLVEFVSQKIEVEYQNELSGIPYITKIKEYKDWINFNFIKQNYSKALSSAYDFKIHINTFKKLSEIPENIQGISLYQLVLDDMSSYLNNDFVNCLKSPYTLANLGNEFRKKIASKENFVKEGIGLINNNKCPFCEKSLDDVENLISQYNKYIADTENKVKSYLKGVRKKLIQKSITSDVYMRIYESFNAYKQKYIPNFSKDLEIINSTFFEQKKQQLIDLIDNKIADIASSHDVNIKEIFDLLQSINNQIEKNNIAIIEFNKILDNSNDQKQQTKRSIVKNFYIHLCITYQKELKDITLHNGTLLKFNEELKELKKEAKTIKKVVGETTKNIIEKFFGDKYQFNPNSFRINFKNSELTGDEPKKVLSQGERSLLTFAYYLGEAHQKIKQDESNYNKLFFIIDDPISSLDFDNVYAVADIIKDIDELFNMKYKRLFVFTHNFEFIRKLKSNNAISQSFEIYNDEIKKLKGNLSIDYYAHLCDIYNVSIGASSQFHTTGNSIRQVIEGIAKFENPKIEQNITKEYIDNNDDIKNGVSNVLIQDLSHGNPFSDNNIGENDWKQICKNTISHITSKYPKQIDYIIHSN